MGGERHWERDWDGGMETAAPDPRRSAGARRGRLQEEASRFPPEALRELGTGDAWRQALGRE